MMYYAIHNTVYSTLAILTVDFQDAWKMVLISLLNQK